MRLTRDEGGAVMVEYALVVALLSLALMTGMSLIENTTLTALNNLQGELVHYGERDGT